MPDEHTMKPRHPALEPDAAAEIERLKGPLMEPDEERPMTPTIDRARDPNRMTAKWYWYLIPRLFGQRWDFPDGIAYLWRGKFYITKIYPLEPKT